MATNRSRRLRKKLCVDEFQELGFELLLNYREDLDEVAADAFLQQFLQEAISANDMIFIGCDEFGMVCLGKRGSVSEEQRGKVDAWLKGRNELESYTLGALADAWYPEKSINA